MNRGLQPNEREPDGQISPAPVAVVSLVGAMPELVAAIPPEDRQLAERTLLARVVAACDEDLGNVLAPTPRDAFDFLIIDGVVLKETALAGRSALELLGPGDVIAPPLTLLHQIESRAVSRYVAHGPVSLAALDTGFKEAARRWPGLSHALYERLGRQTHRASMHLAMLHLPRIEQRVMALFADLAERFGRMTSDGIVIDIRLTHEVIGRLVGSRRPTVSLALHNLGSAGQLSRLDGDRWKLARSALSP